MKLICYNICMKISNDEEVANFLIDQKPDIVCFQEIMRHFEDKVFDMYKSKSVLDKKLKGILPNSFFGPSYFSDGIRLKKGVMHRDFNGFVEQGNQVSSRFEIIEAKNLFFHKSYSLAKDWSNFKVDDHARNIVSSVIDVNGKKVRVLNIHGTHTKDKLDSDRSLKQIKFILDLLEGEDLPIILAGDFNLLPETEGIKMLSKRLNNLVEKYNIHFTRPSFDDGLDVGDNVVDYIFVCDKIKVNDFKVVKTSISDHFPLVLDFEVLS
ncbi:MAG: endonuclease/exonuclease/phosphatase family protein [Candidatus Woesearchaeota archaeon]